MCGTPTGTRRFNRLYFCNNANICVCSGIVIHLATENRIQAALPGVVVKDDRREHVPVLGDRDRRHLQLDGLVEHLVDPARAVEQRKLGVQVEVNELSHDVERKARKVRKANLSSRP